jgi:eukaryotic-like serine/threonine-protein kinase
MTLAAGTRLGQYEVLAPLGSGGMGEVYRARDTRLGREVALKVLPDAFAKDRTRLARFDREARLLASLNHPNVATIFGVEPSGDVPFLALELVPGETLDERIARGPIPVTETLEIARQIAAALESAHACGVIHRDLKPGNVKVTPEGTVKVLDFGLAKAVDQRSSASDSSQSPTRTLEETEQGVVVGTVSYMSPEQVRGKALDKRTDIWSFGCLLYEMLTRKKAFPGETTADKMAAILGHEPDWSALPAETPGSIRELLGRCLQKDAGRRLRDMGDAGLVIEESGESPRSGVPAAGRHVTFRIRRAAIIVAGAVIVAFAGLWLWRRQVTRAALPMEKYLAVLPFKDLSGQPSGQLFADGLAETVSARLSRVQGVQVMPPATSAPVTGEQVDFQRIARGLGANLVLTGSVQRSEGQIRVTYSLLEIPNGVQVSGDAIGGSDANTFAIEDRVAESVASALNLEVRGPVSPSERRGIEGGPNHALYLEALGLLQHYEDEGSLDRAISLLNQILSSGGDSALVQAALGRAYLRKYDLTHEPRWADAAIAACEKAQQRGSGLPDVHRTLGELYTATGRLPQAIAEFRRALAIEPDSADASLGLGEAYAAVADTPHAVESFERAIRLRPSYWAGYNKLGGFDFAHGRYAEAIAMFTRVTELAPDNARGYYNLGAAYHASAHFEEARAAYERSIALQPTSDAYSNLGTLEYTLGKYPEAAAAYEKAVAMTPDSSTLWANLGDAERRLPSQAAKSREAYQRAIALAGRELKVNPRDAWVHVTLALCLAKTGQCFEADRHIREAVSLDPKNADSLFQAAIVANVCGRRKEAIDWIHKALQAGYSRELIQKEPELANLIHDPRP